MKRLLILTILFFGVTVAYGQETCPTGSQCVTNATLTKCANAVDELKVARDVIVKFQNERLQTDAERVAAQTLIKSLNDVLDVRGRIILEYEAMQKIYKNIIDLQGQIIERLTAQLSKGKSGFQKFVGVLEKVVLVLAGIGLAGL